MPRTKTKPEDEAQKRRFIEKAREIGADESGETFERVFREVVPPKQPTKSSPSDKPD